MENGHLSKNIIYKRDEISMYFNYFPLNTIYQCVASFTYQLNVQSARALAIFSEISVQKLKKLTNSSNLI